MLFLIENCTDVSIITKVGAQHMFWSIGSCMESNRYSDYQNYTEKCCLPLEAYIVLCRDFAINNQGQVGNGWEGSYIEVAGNILCKDFIRGPIKEEILIIGKMKICKFYNLKSI